MDTSFLADPIMLSVFGKIVGGAVVLLLAIGFIPGIIIGWFIGKST